MQRNIIFVFALLGLIIFAGGVKADEVNLYGQIGMTAQIVDFHDAIPISDVVQAITSLDLKIDWSINSYLNLYTQVKNDWIYDLRTGQIESKVHANKYFMDLSNGLGTSLRIGKQRLRSGSGVFWSPVDFFHPTAGLLQREGDEDTIESILLETYFIGSTLELVSLLSLDKNYAVGMTVERVSTGYHFEANSFISQSQKAVGVTLETSLEGIDIYSEAALVYRDNQAKIDGLLGLSYLYDWEHNASVRAELYHEGTGNKHSNNFAFGVNYSPSVRWNTSCNIFYRFRENGVMLIPVLKYVLNDNWEFAADGLFTWGAENSFYGNYIIKNKITFSIVRFF